MSGVGRDSGRVTGADAGVSGGLSRGFPPVVGKRPQVLVLGSLPGQASLRRSEYYGQAQNAFWRIMGELCGAGPERHYADRLALLRSSGIALWDVLEAAERPGSLDSAIVMDTARINDIASLLDRERSIRGVCFNGRKAADLYRRRVLSLLPPRAAVLPAMTLPSTSPAYASMRFEAKLAQWRAALAPYIR